MRLTFFSTIEMFTESLIVNGALGADFRLLLNLSLLHRATEAGFFLHANINTYLATNLDS